MLLGFVIICVIILSLSLHGLKIPRAEELGLRACSLSYHQLWAQVMLLSHHILWRLSIGHDQAHPSLVFFLNKFIAWPIPGAGSGPGFHIDSKKAVLSFLIQFVAEKLSFIVCTIKQMCMRLPLFSGGDTEAA